MDEDIRRMIKDAFELEGLLLLADSRGEETSQLLIDAIREKAESLASAAASLEISGGGEVEEDSNLSDFCTGGEASGDDSCIAAAEDEETPEEVEESVPESEEDAATPEEEAEEQPVVTDDEVLLESDGDFMEEQEDEDAADEEPSGENTTSEDVAGDGGEGITLDEAFIRGKSKDLHSAFSLNDMFRFRRELFGNSAADMSDAIELVSAMSSYQEAEDYFYNDLGWDSGSEEVEEFMTIIRNHFR